MLEGAASNDLIEVHISMCPIPMGDFGERTQCQAASFSSSGKEFVAGPGHID